MCKFKPFNKHLLVEKLRKPDLESQSGVLIPEGTKRNTDARYGIVKFVTAAEDCDQVLQNFNKDKPHWATLTGTGEDQFTSSARSGKHISLVVDNSMVEEIKVQGEEYSIIHQNYVVGIVGE